MCGCWTRKLPDRSLDHSYFSLFEGALVSPFLLKKEIYLKLTSKCWRLHFTECIFTLVGLGTDSFLIHLSPKVVCLSIGVQLQVVP